MPKEDATFRELIPSIKLCFNFYQRTSYRVLKVKVSNVIHNLQNDRDF